MNRTGFVVGEVLDKTHNEEIIVETKEWVFKAGEKRNYFTITPYHKTKDLDPTELFSKSDPQWVEAFKKRKNFLKSLNQYPLEEREKHLRDY